MTGGAMWDKKNFPNDPYSVLLSPDMGKKNKPKRVKPQVLKGFRDYPPQEQIAREKMLAKCREAVELMGFLPLQTASLEFAEALLGPHYSEDSLAELFGFQGPDEVNMALRYEFTLSLARYVASQPNLALPFRRYQYGNVWRVDKPGPGRFREFMQFDIDIVGTKNLLADAEIIAAMVTTLDHLGIERFEVRYSNRKILNGLIEWAGIPAERGPDVMRVLDKLEKQGRPAVLQELGEGRVDDSGAEIPGLSLPIDQIDRIKDSDIDLTIVRGLGYYTGPVFETYLKDAWNFGSVFSGGRYDNLVDRFSSQSMPATGSSIGIDRLLAALIELNALQLEKSTSQVLVTVMDRERLPDYLEMLRELREAGIPSEIFAGDTKNITRQVRYADKVGIPFAVIAGSNEFDANQITIKNLAAGSTESEKTADRDEWLKAEGFQETIPRDQLVAFINKHLK
jgi:histidyl-tRNA synthetase